VATHGHGRLLRPTATATVTATGACDGNGPGNCNRSDETRRAIARRMEHGRARTATRLARVQPAHGANPTSGNSNDGVRPEAAWQRTVTAYCDGNGNGNGSGSGNGDGDGNGPGNCNRSDETRPRDSAAHGANRHRSLSTLSLPTRQRPTATADGDGTVTATGDCDGNCSDEMPTVPIGLTTSLPKIKLVQAQRRDSPRVSAAHGANPTSPDDHYRRCRYRHGNGRRQRPTATADGDGHGRLRRQRSLQPQRDSPRGRAAHGANPTTTSDDHPYAQTPPRRVIT
jgi:hypothetical protein